MHTDGLGRFRGLEVAGRDHRPQVTGAARTAARCPAAVGDTVLGNVKRSLAGTCHRFGPKYLAHYPTEFEYRLNTGFHGGHSNNPWE